jgi:ubiquinone/menaquinone biosynthesis C-methylase UbiE
MTLPSVHPAAAEGFSRNAEDYERTRPGYPPDALAHLADVLGLGAGVTVADVAAGTGKLTRLLVPTGAHVIAVEPVAEMRSVLASAVPGAEVLDGVVEHLPLGDASVDAVTIAQAFHWFDGPRALAELARVLRPGGALAVVYNHRDRDAPWLAAVNRLVEAHRHGTPQQWDGRWLSAFTDQPLFTSLGRADFDNPQVLTPEEFLGRMRSMSYVGALPAPEQEALLTAIAALLAEDPATAGRDELVIGQRTSVHAWRRR